MLEHLYNGPLTVPTPPSLPTLAPTPLRFTCDNCSMVAAAPCLLHYLYGQSFDYRVGKEAAT